MTELTQARLKELLHYDPGTGVFVWRTKAGNRVHPGDVAGTNSNGYRGIQVDRRLYKAHRLAWLYMTGNWPAFEIDHKDGVTNNNVFTNLRDVSRALNMQNQRPRSLPGISGYMGVSPHGNSWRAKITVHGRVHLLGMHDTPALASEAYLAAKRQLHTTCTI